MSIVSKPKIKEYARSQSSLTKKNERVNQTYTEITFEIDNIAIKSDIKIENKILCKMLLDI
jgi:hypothetical protein